MSTPTPKHQDQINRSTPAAQEAHLGDVVANLVSAVNTLSAQVAALNTHNSIAATAVPHVVGLESK